MGVIRYTIDLSRVDPVVFLPTKAAFLEGMKKMGGADAVVRESVETVEGLNGKEDHFCLIMEFYGDSKDIASKRRTVWGLKKIYNMVGVSFDFRMLGASEELEFRKKHPEEGEKA